MRQHTVHNTADRGINAYYGNACGRMRGSHKRLCVWRILGMAMLCLAQAALAQPETVIFSSEDKSSLARTGEYMYNFIVQTGDAVASISNLDNPIDGNGYAGILGVNLNLPSWDDWAQATIGLSAKNNGTDYDLTQCGGGIKYRYRGAKHRFPSGDYFRTVEESSIWEWITFYPDDYLCRYYDGQNHCLEASFSGFINWTKEFQWIVRPWDQSDIGTNRNYGNLQISDIVCLGDLDISSVFGIFGSKSMTLAAGYAATSTGAFTVLGETEVEIECEDCDGKITWNTETKWLDIAAGLPAGTYTVALTATNAKGTKEHEFTLTVEANTPIIAAAPKAGTLKARVQNGTLHLSGLTAGKTWSVYNASGALVHSSIASGTEASLHLNASGLYFVRSGAQVGKVLSVVK